MKLFRVQDADRPMLVAAHDWKDAVDRWREQIVREGNPEDFEEGEPIDPDGIELVAERSDRNDFPDLLLPDDGYEAALRYIVERGYTGASFVAQKALAGESWGD